MTDKIVNIDTADRNALVEYAVDTLGLTVKEKATKAEIKNQIKVSLGENAPVMQNKGEAPTTKTDTESEGEEDQAKPPARVTIVIASSETDKLPVTVGVNGKNYVMQRGKEVEVPVEVLEVLDHALQDIFDPETLEATSVMSFPYQIIRK